MSDNKLIDLHKVAGLFREIQTEEFAKEEAKQESEFKKTVEALETTEQEVAEELSAAQKKLPAGLRDAIAKKQGDSTDDNEVEESAPMGEYTDKEFACINTDTGAFGYCGKDELHKFTHMMPAKEFTYFEPQDNNFQGMDDEMADQEGWTKIKSVEEEVTEEPEMVAMDTNTLQQILNLAGLKPVTDSDINQPEADAEPVEEYSNSPDEEYADADTQLNKMSGGINRPKAMPAVGNQGHNDLVTKLKKAYDSRD
jgi:hypothetical protein